MQCHLPCSGMSSSAFVQAKTTSGWQSLTLPVTLSMLCHALQLDSCCSKAPSNSLLGLTGAGAPQAEGLKSKHFMKTMLNDLRKRGQVTTKPARGKSFGYILPEKWLALRKQAEKGQALEQASKPVGLKSRQGKGA